MGEHVVTVHVLFQLHDGVEDHAEDGLVEFRAFAHLVLAVFYGGAKPGFVGLLAAHEGAEIADFECRGEVLVVVEVPEALGFEVEQFELEALRARELPPVALQYTLRDEALVGDVHGKGNQAVHKHGLTLHAGTDVRHRIGAEVGRRHGLFSPHLKAI